MMSLLQSSPPISISHRLFRCRYSNFKFLVANSPSFFGPHRKSASESLLTDYGFCIQVLDSGYFLTRTRIPYSNRQRDSGFPEPNFEFHCPGFQEFPDSRIRVTFNEAKFKSGFTCVGSIWILRDNQWPSAQNCLLESREWSWRTRLVTSYKQEKKRALGWR